MNDVPLREHIEATARLRDRIAIVALLGLIAVGWAVVQGQEKATSVAFDAANEKGVAHNGLIDRMREMSKQYVTWPVVVLLIGLGVSLADRVWDGTEVTVANPPSNPVPVDPAPKDAP